MSLRTLKRVSRSGVKRRHLCAISGVLEAFSGVSERVIRTSQVGLRDLQRDFKGILRSFQGVSRGLLSKTLPNAVWVVHA